MNKNIKCAYQNECFHKLRKESVKATVILMLSTFAIALVVGLII